MKTMTFRNAAAPKPFASVRGSRDVSLIAFGAALLAAFALQAGAFIPRLTAPEGRREAQVAVQAATSAPEQASVVASPSAPCVLPQG